VDGIYVGDGSAELTYTVGTFNFVLAVTVTDATNATASTSVTILVNDAAAFCLL
jgi:hypothetical protein